MVYGVIYTSIDKSHQKNITRRPEILTLVYQYGYYDYGLAKLMSIGL